MKRSVLGRYALNSAAAAMLAGCGGSQPPIGTSGAIPQAPAIAARPRTIVGGKGNSSPYEVLHSFGGSGDGSVPLAGLLKVKGTLYGTTLAGGVSADGTVFSITPSGTETVLYSFNGSDGKYPYAALINVKGALYGTTYQGGNESGLGDGTIFSITPSGTETVLHRFGSQSDDGALPYAGLLNVKGTLYGTTYYGGANYYGYGTVFSITPSGTETVLHSFAGVEHGDGLYPQAGLINVNGPLYGTTSGGGANYDGTVFKITTRGKETVLHSFGGSGDGTYLYAGLINVKGTLYGTTVAGGSSTCRYYTLVGCGTVFSITPSGIERVLYSFAGGSGDGANPQAGLLNVNGTLYGTTEEGGAYGYGTVFRITRGGKETVLHSFAGGSGDGANPYAGLINVKGTFYGTTARGGANNDGTVFSLTL
jgi:uncharacterized repeat protein (TIGR03803 family)